MVPSGDVPGVKPDFVQEIKDQHCLERQAGAFGDPPHLF